MKKLFLILIIACSSLVSGYAGDILDLDKTLRKNIELLSKELSKLIDLGIEGLDFVAEQRLTQGDIILHNFQMALQSDLDKKLSQLDDNVKIYIQSIENMITEGLDDFKPERLSVLINANLTEFCEYSSAIVCPDKNIYYSIRYIENYVLTYRSQGNYKVEFGGNAIRQDRNSKLEINNLEIEPDQVPSSGFITFTIPNTLIKNNFDDTKNSRIAYRLITTETTSKFFGLIETIDTLVNLKSNLLLLPKYPIKYSITEHINENDWDDCPNCFYLQEKNIKNGGRVEFSFNALPNDKKYSRVEVTPKNYVKYYIEPTKLIFGDGYCKQGFGCIETVSQGGIKVDIKCNLNTLCGKGFPGIPPNKYKVGVPGIPALNMNISAKLFYKSASPVSDDKDLKLVESTSGLSKLTEGFLSYGTHLSQDLSENSGGYTIRLYPFYWNPNAEYNIISSSIPSDNQEDVFKATAIRENLGVKSRIRLEIKPPSN